MYLLGGLCVIGNEVLVGDVRQGTTCSCGTTGLAGLQAAGFPLDTTETTAGLGGFRLAHDHVFVLVFRQVLHAEKTRKKWQLSQVYLL